MISANKIPFLFIRHIFLLFLLPFSLCALFGISARAVIAQTTSTIEGTVSDPQGRTISGALVEVEGHSNAVKRAATADALGFYRVSALPAATYTVTASHAGFAAQSLTVEVALNHSVSLNIVLAVGQVREEVTIPSDALLDTASSMVATNIRPREIAEMPLNGRNYLDLMQLVPGVAVNRQADTGTDTSVAVLGERGGNTGFLLDGFSNADEVNGGAAFQVMQDAVEEFQVITIGYKAEFGRASGGVVNVVTKSGTNEVHGVASLFHRNDALDASNVVGLDAPALRRWDYSLALGGPVMKNRIFFFGSAERLQETRRLNFIFPPNIPTSLLARENGLNSPTRDRESRFLFRLDEQWGSHRLTQQFNLSTQSRTGFLPLSQATNLPSTRQDSDARHLHLAVGDMALIGDKSNPFVLSLRVQLRREPSTLRPSHPEAGAATTFHMFSDLTTGGFFGDLGQITYGSSLTPSNLKQRYSSAEASLARFSGRHDVKFGWSFTRTSVDGVEAKLLLNQLFATISDFEAFASPFSGLFTLRTRGGATAEDSLIRLRNNYNGLFVQDGWRLRNDLTLNLGWRWDYDSAFNIKRNFSPRVGFAWAVTSKTVVRGSWGVFYDHFRLGVVRDIPAFGGANISNIQPVSYPRLLYGVPTILPIVLGLCLSPTLTDAQISATGVRCPFGPLPLIGVDRLNRVVAPGHAPIPAGVVVTINNVGALTGLAPQQFVDQASIAVGRSPGYFFWGPFGALTQTGSPTTPFPVTLDPSFRTPHTRSFSVGVQHEISKDTIIGAEYVHKQIRNITGVRLTNISFIARLPGFERRFEEPSTSQEIRGFGPWFKGRFDALSLTFNTRFDRRISLAASYTYTRAIDNLRCPDLSIGLSVCVPSDSFVGVPPVVIDPGSGQSNADAPFTATNGNPVPQAGRFYNGPDFDRGPSDLALKHTFVAHGIVELPWQFAVSGIFRGQSGFTFSRQASVPLDVDGDQNFNTIDHAAGRNAFTAPPFVNLDVRFSKRFEIGERVRLTALFEFFNLLNRRNPAAVENAEGRPTPFGEPLQVLPGREGQIGLRIEF